ncbi:tryptophan halogenase family protein [Massilia sp. AB1]|uniref:tryptophan halogenase family protein n=1 Tax=Massilia sp. AB1 TaxID=2823371 RepID=UPI001B81FDE8|nr:tryptophan halogenase family protein [Massilia sp. AB1]MBQ5941864.1 tryptophan 7-halogenase [Massilia sp. AB1]
MIPFKSLVIVGGGTAGWLAATYLQRALGANPAHPVSITLIESEDISSIGVGEATLPSLRQTLRTIGIPEADLFGRAEATLKNGIRFVGWREGGDEAAGDRYDHPFDTPIAAEGYSTMTHWLNLKQRGLMQQPFTEVGVVQPALMDAMRSPKLMASPAYDAPISYGYHLDAVLLAHLLRDAGIRNGVRHVVGTVEQVELNEAGIAAVRLKDGARHAADFFIDCSGFSSLLLGKALQVPFQSYGDTLLCDRAVACPVEHENPGGALRSYTVSTAQKSGWTWDIDLQSRKGTGYVYASRFCSDDEAAATLAACNAGRKAIGEPRVLRMRVGRHVRAWEKNCLALGLSSGFIEPLESTGIYLIEHALQLWLDYLPVRPGAQAARECYNGLMADLYDELHDFVLLHYVISQRRDTPFWRAYTEEVKLPDRLQALLALWREKLPSATDINRHLSTFGAHNWFYILSGMRHLPEHGSAQSPFIPPEHSRAALARIEKIRAAAVAQSPSMREYAQKMHAAAANAPRS